MSRVFDYQDFFETRGIPYWTRGKNVSSGELSIKCPWCSDDPSHHLNVNPKNGLYGCWRNRSHRGKSSTKLVQALLRCSWEQAQAITKETKPIQEEDFLAIVKDNLQGNQEDFEREGLASHKMDIDLPDHFDIIRSRGRSRQHFEYLKERGFAERDIEYLIEDYMLMFSTDKQWSQRIIIPLQDEDGAFVSWVGRSIREDAEVRYKALSENEAILTTKELIFYPEGIMAGGDALLVAEGPFDALKLDFYLRKYSDMRATCLFGLEATDTQLWKLQDLVKVFDSTYILLDREAEMKAVSLLTRSGIDAQILDLPEEFDDPGEFDEVAIATLANQLLCAKVDKH